MAFDLKASFLYTFTFKFWTMDHIKNHDMFPLLLHQFKRFLCLPAKRKLLRALKGHPNRIIFDISLKKLHYSILNKLANVSLYNSIMIMHTIWLQCNPSLTNNALNSSSTRLLIFDLFICNETVNCWLILGASDTGVYFLIDVCKLQWKHKFVLFLHSSLFRKDVFLC